MLRDYQHWFPKQYRVDMPLGWELLELVQVLLAFLRYLISNKAVISTEKVKSSDSVKKNMSTLEFRGKKNLWKYGIISNEQEHFACLTLQAISPSKRVMNHMWLQDGNNYSAKQITSIQYLKLTHHLPCIWICYSTSKTNTIHKIFWRTNTTLISHLHHLVSHGHHHREHVKYKAEDT
jgi:hypothetical protein